MGIRRELVRLELYKLIKTRYILAILPMLLIPLLQALTIFFNVKSYDGPLNQSALFWLNGQLLNSTIFLLMPLSYIVIAAGFLAREIADRSIHLYIPRVSSRTSLYRAKIIALLIFGTLLFVLTCLIIVLVYYAIVANTPIGTGQLLGDCQVWENLVNIIISYCYNCLIMTSAGLALSVYMKTLPSVVIMGLGIIVTQFILFQFSGFLTDILPWNNMIELISMVDTTSKMSTNYPLMIRYLSKNISTSVLFSFFAYLAGAFKFKGKNL